MKNASGRMAELARKTARTTSESGGKAKATKATAATRSAKLTVNLHPDVLRRIHAAVWETRDTVTDLVERAVVAEVDRLERSHGGAFKEPPRKIRTGRPPGR